MKDKSEAKKQNQTIQQVKFQLNINITYLYSIYDIYDRLAYHQSINNAPFQPLRMQAEKLGKNKHH